MRANDPIDASYPELFPKDFGERLARLAEITGLSWEEFAERLGVGCDRVTESRGGEVPTGAEVWHIMRLAFAVCPEHSIRRPAQIQLQMTPHHGRSPSPRA